MLDRWLPYVYYQLEYIRWLEVITLVGAQPVALEPYLQATPADLEETYKAVQPGEGPLAALHPGAGDRRRRWPPEKFAAVGDALAEAGARVVVTGAYEEPGVAQRVVDAMRRPARNLHGRLSLGGLAGLFSRCRVVVSNDSGPLHLARAVGAPTVGVYWVGNMITAGPLSVARHRTAISWRLECPTCGANTIHSPCEHRDSFVADVGVDEVRAAALELWSEPERSLPVEWPSLSLNYEERTL
jgi:ADP-heptose:LPS heptosyltransferase